jgi:hypothetical protein
VIAASIVRSESDPSEPVETIGRHVRSDDAAALPGDAGCGGATDSGRGAVHDDSLADEPVVDLLRSPRGHGLATISACATWGR